MADDVSEAGAREMIAELDRKIAAEHAETVDRIERLRRFRRGRELERAERDEWGRHHDRVLPMQREREAIVKALADVVGLRAPPPIILAAAKARTKGE